MAPRANLEQIQRWMQSVIMHGGGVAEGVESPEARQHLDVPEGNLESVIRRSRALSAESRLEIYVDAYYERLLECLREEFPATRTAVGEELFDALAFGYLQHYPSRSYTLARLGASLARYLGEARLHEQALPEGAPATWADFVIELAELERVQREVFDAPGSETLPPVNVEHLLAATAGDVANVRLATVPCLRLCAFAHPVHEYWLEVKREEPPLVPAPRQTLLAINRRDYLVEREELSGAQFALLEALMTGRGLGEAIALAATLPGVDPRKLARGLGEWFARWARLGYFVDSRPG
jgi:hypothetical protein